MELRGLEPLTPCMPCKCSSQLSYSPTTSDEILYENIYDVEYFLLNENLKAEARIRVGG